MIMLNFLINFDLGEGVQIKSYDPSIIKEWLNSYPYLYKGFTPNKGQLATMDGNIAENVIFYSKNGNMGIFITENGMSYVIYDVEKREAKKDKDLLPHIKENPENSILHYARIDYELIGGKIKKENIIYQDELPGYENFYLAHCPDGILFVKSYRKVIIKDIYPGINWIFRYDDNGNFHHEFEIKNPQLISRIKLRVKYADIELTDNSKSIILSTPIGKIKDGSLRGYQGNSIVDVSYKLIDNNLIVFDVKSFDKDKLLLIDPHALIWSTYYGGSSGEEGYSITTDINGNVFVTGLTGSTDFPTQDAGGGAYFQGYAGNDIFILKFNNLGVRLWATYYGGSSDDISSSIIADIQGNIFITGYTISNDFPVYDPQNGAYFDGNCEGCPFSFSDIFILKFTNSGVRLWATYYGGVNFDYGYSISVDGQGNIFLTGATNSTGFPTYNPGGNTYFQGSNAGLSDAFILKFNNSGARLWATYYGGSGNDRGLSIRIDLQGNVFVTGNTWSSDFPIFNPQNGAYFDNTCGTDGNCNYNGNVYFSDIFILKFDNSGVRLWATYYGGSKHDQGHFITTDAQGNLFLTGKTNSPDFPTYDPQNGAYYQGTCAGGCTNSDAYILKFNNLGILQWATYYGGSAEECYNLPCSIVADAQNNIFMTGLTLSSDFPIQNPNDGSYYQGSNAGGSDAFILKFNNVGARIWATYYGGNDADGAYSITVDPNNNIFLTGTTASTNFPTYDPGNNAYYQSSNMGTDAFISKLGNSSSILEKTTYYYKNKISFNLFNFSCPITISIYSLDGNLIYSDVFKTNNIEINLKSLKSGIYILKAYSSNNKQLTYKLIKF
ncbi:MAG: SBBP repeat-containing protein [candidate division WOR-3 bacterium]